jgi:hypothetical protein
MTPIRQRPSVVQGEGFYLWPGSRVHPNPLTPSQAVRLTCVTPGARSAGNSENCPEMGFEFSKPTSGPLRRFSKYLECAVRRA